MATGKINRGVGRVEQWAALGNVGVIFLSYCTIFSKVKKYTEEEPVKRNLHSDAELACAVVWVLEKWDLCPTEELGELHGRCVQQLEGVATKHGHAIAVAGQA